MNATSLYYGGGPASAFTAIVSQTRTQAAALPWRLILPTLLAGYVALVQLLRFRALRAVEAKFHDYLANPYALSYQQAREILHLPMLHDMPFLFGFGTQWALIKSYGIATGTPLLDTAVFITEFLVGDIDSRRGRLALARLNWLHRRYDILQGDYIHTLALFVLEPQRWIARFEWRALSELECVAHFIYWREIGHRMGFGGIPETLEELAVWKEEYEKKNLYFIESNRTVTEATLQLFLRGTPRILHGVMRSLFVSFIDEKKVRDALGFKDAPKWAVVFTKTFFTLRGLVLRHLFLPRSRPLDVLPKEGPDGRFFRSPKYFAFEPWYVGDSWSNRIRTWLRSKGKLTPGKQFQSEGYLQEELGPIGTQNAAKNAIFDQAEALEEYIKSGGSAGTGCPFDFGWKK